MASCEAVREFRPQLRVGRYCCSLAYEDIFVIAGTQAVLAGATGAADCFCMWLHIGSLERGDLCSLLSAGHPSQPPRLLFKGATGHPCPIQRGGGWRHQDSTSLLLA